MSPAQLARRNRSDLEAMFIALLALLLAVAAFAVVGHLADDDDGAAVDVGSGSGTESAEEQREAALALATSDEAEHEHADGDATHDEHADGTHDDNHSSGTHDDTHADGTHDDTHADGTHDDNHSSGTHDDNNTDGHSHTTTPGDTTPDGHNHGPTIPGQTTVPHDDGHNHGTPPTTTAGSAGTTPTTTHDHGTVTTVPGDTTPTTDGHSHTDGPNVQLADLPPDIRTAVTNATNSILQYNTTAKAAAGGWQKLTQYFPGIAAHYGNLGLVLDTTSVFDPTKVDILLFNGTGSAAQLVGINYILYSPGGPPEGFPGDFDGWHRHANLCLLNGVIVGEAPEGGNCPAGQTEIFFGNYWLLHVWSIAGWESPEGIFSHYNSRV